MMCGCVICCKNPYKFNSDTVWTCLADSQCVPFNAQVYHFFEFRFYRHGFYSVVGVTIEYPDLMTGPPSTTVNSLS